MSYPEFNKNCLKNIRSTSFGDLIWWMSPILNQLSDDMELIVFSMQDKANADLN